FYHLLGQSIDSFGKTKIKLGQSALTVGRENQMDFVVTNVDVWMVFFFLGHFSHSLHEINRIGKIIELKRAFDVLLLQLPLRDFLEPRFQLVRFHQISHNGTTSNTRKSFCNAKTSGCFCERHPERSAVESKDHVALPEGDSAGFFDCASRRFAALRMTARYQGSSGDFFRNRRLPRRMSVPVAIVAANPATLPSTHS